jgi:hypothetical protein
MAAGLIRARTMDNKDLQQIMQHYRKEVKKNVNNIFYRKVGTVIVLFGSMVVCMKMGWLWLLSLVFMTEVLLWYFTDFFKLPPLAMNDAFLLELSKLEIQDTKALDELKERLKAKAYLLYDEVEDFIEREIATRKLNQKLSTEGAKALLSEEE